jgi:hypothetical protein
MALSSLPSGEMVVLRTCVYIYVYFCDSSVYAYMHMYMYVNVFVDNAHTHVRRTSWRPHARDHTCGLTTPTHEIIHAV